MSFVQKVYKFRQAVTEGKNVLPCLSFLQGALLLWIGICLCGTQALFAQKGNQADVLFQAASQRIKSGVMIDFASETVNTKGQTLHSTKGTVKLLDRCFRLRFDDLDVNYDGNSSYSYYDRKNDNFVLFDGNKEHVADMNPILVLSSWKQYKRSLLSSANGKNKYSLTPLASGSAVSRFIVTFDRGRALPTRIEAVSREGYTTVVSVTREVSAPKLKRGDFVQTASEYPSAEVIDLR